MTCRSFLFRTLLLCAFMLVPAIGAGKHLPASVPLPSDELPLTPPKNAIEEVGGQETDLPPGERGDKAIAEGARVDFAAGAAVMELLPHLVPYDTPDTALVGPGTARAVHWYVFTAANPSTLPVSRILIAGSLPDRNLRLIPHRGRARLVQLVSGSVMPITEPIPAYGKAAFRLRLPPHTAADMAVGLTGAADPPSLLAWTPAALTGHRTWRAIFQTTVLALLAVALSLVGGLMVLAHDTPIRWACALLCALFLMVLAQSGLIDGVLMTPVGGPFGLSGLFVGLALLCGILLVDQHVPFPDVVRQRGRFSLWAIVALALLGWLGVPGATLVLNGLAIAVTVVLGVYLLTRLGQGVPAARPLAPAALLFMLYALSAWLGVLGLFGNGALRPEISDAFLAAGAMVLLLSLVRGRVLSGAVPDPEADLTREAIGAAATGAFRLNLASGRLWLSPMAARLVGRGGHSCRISLADWRAMLCPEDCARFDAAVADSAAPAVELILQMNEKGRVHGKGDGARFLGLRGRVNGPICVGMLSDVSARQAVAAEEAEAGLRDRLTGAGNREALIHRLEELGGQMRSALFAMVTLDGFSALRHKLGDPRCDLLLKLLFERLRSCAPAGELFRVHGDAFAVLWPDGAGLPSTVAAELVRVGVMPYALEGEGAMAPVSVGLAEGRKAADPLELMYHAELALRQAQCHGGCARIFAPGMDALAPSDVEGLDAALSQALEAGAIEVIYLPLIRPEDQTVAGFRTRLRWRQLPQGMLEPCALAAYSEDGGLVTGLQRFIVENVAASLAEWQQYFPLSEPLFATVPVMPQLMGDDGLDQYLAGALLPSVALEPDSLKFELLYQHVSVAGLAKRLPALQTAGAGFMLSDYVGRAEEKAAIGTLPLEIVALNACGRVCDGDMLAAFVARVHKVGARALICGAESAEDAARIREAGGDLVCGGAFAPPLNAGQTLKFIAENFRAADSKMAG